ncbi:MAG TPA: DUF2304 domain-containing protein [Candidatus Aphodovivens avistercoris]|nr:DUF2304 domain-containing protein [Candidatus Aphodovivens avistercoris]
MSSVFRVALVAGAILVFAFVLRKIRHSEIKVADSTFWFLFALSFVLLAVFPQIAFFCSDTLGIESPANFVYLYVIAVLVLHNFSLGVELSKVRSKLVLLIQEEALSKAEGSRDETQ